MLISLTKKKASPFQVNAFIRVEPQPHLSNQAKQDLRKLIEVLEVDNGDIYMDK